MDKIAEWSSKNSLVLNPDKSKWMILGTKKQVVNILNNNPSLCILGRNIERVKEAKNLGVIFDEQLRFESHISNVVKNCFYRLKILYRIRHLLSVKVRITLCESLVLSRFNYGDLVYGPRLLRKTQRLIQKVQNACCRFSFNISPRSHISPYLNMASMLNMESRRQLHLATLLFGVMKFKNPEYLHSKLKFSTFYDRYYSRSVRPPLSLQCHKTVAFTGSFRYQATKCWNNIPPPLRIMTSLHTFRKNIKEMLLEKQKSVAEAVSLCTVHFYSSPS